jgi:hypothetical protein
MTHFSNSISSLLDANTLSYILSSLSELQADSRYIAAVLTNTENSLYSYVTTLLRYHVIAT